MIVFIWRIAFLVSAVLFIAGLILMLCLNVTKNKYYHQFEDDELIKNTKSANSKNSIYFTSGETRKYIKKYVMCRAPYDKYLVCNFAERFKKIVFFVVQYSKHGRVISVLKASERDTGDTSKIIALNRRCDRVNIVIRSANGTDINSEVIRPLPIAHIRLYAFLKSFVIFLGLFAARHLLIELIAGEMYIKQYLMNLYNYIAVGGSFILGVISYFITVKCFRRKSSKVLNGGALEYEFV